MDRYKIEGKLGSGAFGAVYRATHRDTGIKVAIKKMRQRYPTWEESLALREIQALCALQNHPSLVKLFAVIRQDERLYLVFEFVGPNLYEAVKDRKQPLPEAKIRSWLRQALQGLEYMHRAGYVHRDIKPENLLLRGGTTLKIADLGLVRSVSEGGESERTSSNDENSDEGNVNGASPFEREKGGKPWTEYVSTRWYRSPEVLLQSPNYGAPIDVFALGVVAAELYALRPLFPGTSEPDQLACIASVLGYPTEKTWAEGVQLAARLGFAFPEQGEDVSAIQNLRELLPAASVEAVDLIAQMCCWDPNERITAEQALQHPYFTGMAASVTPVESTEAGIIQQQQRRMSKRAAATAGITRRAPLATPQAAAVTAQLLQAAARVGRQEEALSENPALKRLAQRAAKRQRATLRLRKTSQQHGAATGKSARLRRERKGDQLLV